MQQAMAILMCREMERLINIAVDATSHGYTNV